ncbi:MAG TPA: LLM class flavin-dependent oxidoreductase [Thermoanaerobaculia bacterium]|nr:LLM class flavin-dependent oxidoreductase [Thermoanaerobaculia bacterium]
MAIRFHWRLPLGGEEAASAAAGASPSALPDFAAQLAFCRLAERCGIDSLLTACGFYMPDPIPLVAALGGATRTVRFLLAYRPGLLSPTLFVQQVNTLAALSGGRISLNVVMGHSAEEQRAYGDFLDHDERYRRADEFLEVCRAFWRGEGEVSFSGQHYRIENARLKIPFASPDRQAPEIYLGGSSPPALAVAARHGDCWLRLADAPEALRPQVEEMRRRGIEVGLRLSLVSRPTREEAVAAAYALLDGGDTEFIRQVFVQGSDSATMTSAFASRESHWLTPWLWNGAVASRGASAICLVGSPEEVVAGVLEYRRIGVTQFIFSGWPNSQALTYFGEEILPLLRAREENAS